MQRNLSPPPLKGETTEHIPQKCLFNGYGSEYKINIITIPSCRECNTKYSKLENELHDLIGISNDDNDKQIELTKKGVKSIFNKVNWKDRIYTDEQGNVQGVEFDYEKLAQNHIKNYKGIYYKEFNCIVPFDYNINVADRPMNNPALITILEFIESNAPWKHSGHEDIFRYKIVAFKNLGGQIVKTQSLSGSIGVFGLLEYHKSIQILVIGKNKS